MKFRAFDVIAYKVWKMYGIWNVRFLSMEWNGLEDFEGYGICKISIPFHSIACPAIVNELLLLITY